MQSSRLACINRQIAIEASDWLQSYAPLVAISVVDLNFTDVIAWINKLPPTKVISLTGGCYKEWSLPIPGVACPVSHEVTRRELLLEHFFTHPEDAAGSMASRPSSTMQHELQTWLGQLGPIGSPLPHLNVSHWVVEMNWRLDFFG